MQLAPPYLCAIFSIPVKRHNQQDALFISRGSCMGNIHLNTNLTPRLPVELVAQWIKRLTVDLKVDGSPVTVGRFLFHIFFVCVLHRVEWQQTNKKLFAFNWGFQHIVFLIFLVSKSQ